MANSKSYIKDYNKIYKNMVVTFREFFDALKELGYKDVSNTSHLRFQRVAHSVLSIPNRPLDDLMQQSDFRTYSYIIYMKGDINAPEDLAKIIARNREQAKTEAISA